MKKLLLLIAAFVMIVSCAPAQYKPFVAPEVKFEATQPYVLDLSALKKPGKPIYVALDAGMRPITSENPGEAKYLAFSKSEFKKIMALSAAYNDQRELLESHEDLVNVYISEINALKELVALREQIIKQYIELYAMSENAYRQERYEHKWDNAESKIVQILMTAGLILLML
jgi:hypothetical protein